MSPSRTPEAALTSTRKRVFPAGQLLSLSLIAGSSLAGALALSAAALGASPPRDAGPGGSALLGGSWLLLAGWALLYVVFIRRLASPSLERALYWAALCHTPLLLSLALVAAVRGSGLPSQVYLQSRYGPQMFLPITADYLVAAPALAQGLLLAVLRWRSWVRHWPILAVVMVALALRLSHAGWGLPALLHPDESRYYGPATIMAARGDLNPHYFQNPSLMIYLTYVTLAFLAPQSRAFMAADQLFNLGIANPRGDFLDMVALRAVVAGLGALTVVAVYLVGRELFSRRAALLGASILAVSFLHVRNSHYATNDVLATALLSISFLFSVRIYNRGKAADYLLAAFFGGLGTSAKYNVGLFGSAILVAHLAVAFRSGIDRYPKRRHLLLLAAAAVSLAAFLLGTPYALLDLRAFAADFREQLTYGADPWFGQQAQPSSLIFLSTLAWGFGALPLVLAALAAILMGRHNKSRLLLLLAIPASYFAFMSTQRLFFARFAIPTLPFLALLAGYGIQQLGMLWERRGPRAALPFLLLVAALAQPLALTIQHDRLLAQTDTRFLAAQWIDANLPQNASLATESYSLLDPKFGWRGHHVQNSYVFWPENEAERERAFSGEYRFVEVSSFGYGPWQGEGDPPSSLPPEYRQLETKGKLVAIFAPGMDNREIPYAIDDMYTPFWHLFDRRRPGPTVRIYEMAR